MAEEKELTGRRGVVAGEEAYGGGGSVVDGAVAPVLPRASGGDDEVWSGATNSMVATELTHTSSGSGETRTEARLRRRAPVEHAQLDSLPKTSKRGSGEVRTSEERRRGWVSGSGYGYLAGETKKMAAETRNSGELLRRPGGVFWRGTRGESERRR